MMTVTTLHPSIHCVEAPDHTCSVHGGAMVSLVSCQTLKVLSEVRAERARQFSIYGTNASLEDGTGPHARWLLPYSAAQADEIEVEFRGEYEAFEAANDAVTWRHLVREEIAEAFQESDPVRLREELLQVAALCVSWVEKIDSRA